MSDSSKKMRAILVITAIITTVIFLLFLLVPSLTYGGYMGLTLASLLFGAVEGTLIFQFMIFGGMILGVIAIWALMVVLSSVCVASIFKLGKIVRERF